MLPEVQLHLDLLQGFGNVYLGVLAMGLFYGLTLCNFTCIPLVGPFVFATQGGFERGFEATAVFVAARVASYTLLGGLSGWVGGIVLEAVDPARLVTAAGVLVLLIGALAMLRPRACRGGCRTGSSRRSWLGMAALGFSTSLMPCLPLSAVLLYAATTGSPLTGCGLALAFGIGTAASPLYYIGGAAGWLSGRLSRRIPHHDRLLRVLSGAVLAVFGVRLLMTGGLLV